MDDRERARRERSDGEPGRRTPKSGTKKGTGTGGRKSAVRASVRRAASDATRKAAGKERPGRPERSGAGGARAKAGSASLTNRTGPTGRASASKTGKTAKTAKSDKSTNTATPAKTNVPTAKAGKAAVVARAGGKAAARAAQAPRRAGRKAADVAGSGRAAAARRARAVEAAVQAARSALRTKKGADPAKARRSEPDAGASRASKGTAAESTDAARVAGSEARQGAIAAATGVGVPVPANSLGIYELHVSFNTRWTQAMLEFYRDKLGFDERPAGRAWGGTGARTASTPVETVSRLTELEYLVVGIFEGGSLGFMDWQLSARMAEQQVSPAPPAPDVGGLYFLCRDVDELFRVLGDRGVAFDGPPAVMPWGHRLVRTTDPEGRSLVFAQIGSDDAAAAPSGATPTG